MDVKAFFKLSYGMYVIASNLGDKLNGQIANTVFQITSDPPMVAVSINKQNLTHSYIHESGIFSISALSVDTPMEFIGKFGFKSGRDIDKLQDTSFDRGENGVPVVLDNALSCFVVKVEKEVDVYTHTIFVGRVIDAKVIASGEQMTYDYYHKVKQGLSPKNAPTYLQSKADNADGSKNLNQYKCNICGYVYAPEKGDPNGGIPSGTAFEDLPADWVCPICGASKDEFQKIE